VGATGTEKRLRLKQKWHFPCHIRAGHAPGWAFRSSRLAIRA